MDLIPVGDISFVSSISLECSLIDVDICNLLRRLIVLPYWLSLFKLLLDVMLCNGMIGSWVQDFLKSIDSFWEKLTDLSFIYLSMVLWIPLNFKLTVELVAR